MKLHTAFKLSAVAVALTSTSMVFAATLDTNVINSDLWVKDNSELEFNKGQDKPAGDYQFVDLGSSSAIKDINYDDGIGTNELVQLYTGKDENGVDADVFIIKGKQYVIEDQKLVDFKGTLGSFVNGGTANDFKDGIVSEEQIIKRLDSDNVTYGEKKVEKDQGISLDLAVTDSQGNVISQPDLQAEGAGPSKEVSETVSLGIINATDAKQDKYGVYAQKIEDGKVTAESKLTANGIETTGTIKINGKDVTAELKSANDKADTANTTANTAKTTAESAKELAVTANTTADAAKELAETANTTADVAKELAGTANTTAVEAKELAGTANTTAGEAKELAETANTSAEAADKKASETLKAVSGFDDRIVDLNKRADQLNKRVDDVEKTAYRGVAIALAAQQNVPNIKPGQYAVFGGVGHYESESAFAMGVVGAINERTSISGAIGVAGGSEVGGRVGLSYVFGGK